MFIETDKQMSSINTGLTALIKRFPDRDQWTSQPDLFEGSACRAYLLEDSCRSSQKRSIYMRQKIIALVECQYDRVMAQVPLVTNSNLTIHSFIHLRMGSVCVVFEPGETLRRLTIPLCQTEPNSACYHN